jgi:DNA-binding CsgD family transcriptional regulator
LAERASELAGDAAGIEEVMLRFRGLIGDQVSFDGFCACVFDPVSLLPSWHTVHTRVPPTLLPHWGNIEVSKPEHFICFAGGRARATTRRLSEEAGGTLERCARYREVFRHVDLKHELRVPLRARGLVWGYVCLIRDAAAPDFAPEEVARVESLSTALGEAVRRTFLGGPAPNALDESPAVLLLSAENRVISCSDVAQGLVGEIDVCGQSSLAIRAVAQCARHPLEWPRPAAVRALRRDGRWFTIRATALDGAKQVAIVMEPIRSSDAAAMMLAAYGLSMREREIAQHVLRGLSTVEIGEALDISEYTVQSHLTSIFDKTGFGSRKELAARLFRARHGMAGLA